MVVTLGLVYDGTGETLACTTRRIMSKTHQLLARLLQQEGDEIDASWTAHGLLAATRIDLVSHSITAEGLSRARLRANLRSFVERVIA